MTRNIVVSSIESRNWSYHITCKMHHKYARYKKYCICEILTNIMRTNMITITLLVVYHEQSSASSIMRDPIDRLTPIA